MPTPIDHALRLAARRLPTFRLRSLAFRIGQRCAARRPREIGARLPGGDEMVLRLDEYVGYAVFVHGAFEQREVDCVLSQLGPGDVFLDIGAHMGIYSVQAARVVGPRGQVHAFEPGPRQRGVLERNTARAAARGGARASVRPLAVGAEPGAVTFVQGHSSNLGQSYVQRGPGEGLTVEMTTIDAYTRANGVGRVDVIKIDVEGNELGVLLGGRGLLERSPPRLIAFECIDSISRGGGTPEQVFDLLRSYGYRFAAVTDDAVIAVEGYTRPYREYVAIGPGAIPRGPLAAVIGQCSPVASSAV